MLNIVNKLKRHIKFPRKIEPSHADNNKVFLKPANFMDMLEQFWVSKPNNVQGAIVYETTFVQGGFTSFVTIPSGQCYGTPKRCRSAENSRQLAARVALTHCMFGGAGNASESLDSSSESIDSAINEILQKKSMGNLKYVVDEHSKATLARFLERSMSSRSSPLEQYELVLKADLIHWSGYLRKLARMRYSNKQVNRELSRLSLDQISELMTLEWRLRETRQPGTICLELAKTRYQLHKTLARQGDVRLAKEKCMILLTAIEGFST